MAIISNTPPNDTNPRPQQSPQQSAQAQPQGPRQTYTHGGTPSFGLNSQLSNFGTGGDVYEKIFTKIQDNLKKINEDQKGGTSKFLAVKLLKNQAGLNYSGIVIVQKDGVNIAAHILMIEKTGLYPDKLTESVGQIRYEIIRTPADALDETYVLQAQRAVGASLGVASESIIIVDGTLVPNEFDAENDNAVIALLSNALNAVTTELAIRINDFKGIDLGNLIKENRNGKFYVSLHFNGDDATYFDQAGMPVRQDVCISLSYKVNAPGANNRSINQGEERVEISKVYGYVDFEFIGRKPMNGGMSTQCMLPNFVITDIDAGVAPTPDILMLGVASVLSLNEDMNWMQAFRPTTAKKNEIDFNDIGALNVEGNIEGSPTGFGKRYDTKGKTVTHIELNRLLQTLVYPNMIISIDLPKAGPRTWATSAFWWIKMHNNAAAARRVRDFMVTSTSGAFTNVPANVPMFDESSKKYYGGFYKAKDGYKDIRHLGSYLSLANFLTDTNQSPAQLAEYTNTLYTTGISQDLQASTRRVFIDEMSGKTAVYKGMYDRVAFNGQFLGGWVSALHQIGFSPIFTNTNEVNDMFVKRSTGNFQAAMLGQDVRLMGSSNSPYNGWQGGVGYTRGF
jgi:hypothetical protein